MTLTVSLLLVASVIAWQQPPRDLPVAPDAPRGTATVRGRVLDGETGAPIPRAAVVLVRMSGRGAPARRFVRSGENGSFEFLEVVAGSYHLGADTGDERPTHLVQLVGAEGPSQRLTPLIPQTSIEIRDGEVRSDLDIRLARALAIAGAVVNDFGEPLANMDVRAELIRGGRIIRRSSVRRTDDRGEFRLFGLPPGRYRVCALVSSPYVLTSVFPERLVSTCYPSAAREQDAGLVVLASGTEPQVQIRMQQSRLFRLAGVVVDASGSPAPGASVHVSTRDRLNVYRMTFQTDVNGRFTVADLVPGEYDLEATVPGPNQPSRHRAEFAFETVRVEGADAEVVLSMVKTAKVAGHVMFDEGGVPPPAAGMPMSVIAIGTSRAPRPDVARVRADLTFELDELHGPQLLDVDGVPEGWVLKSIRYAGADVTETPTEFRSSADARHLQITLTRRGGSVGGRVLDAAGQPLGGARVFLIAAEPHRWARGGSGSQSVSEGDGTFTFGLHRPGDYLIVALAQDDAPDLYEREREDYQVLAKIAERITLAEGERLVVTVRTATLPEDR